MTCSRKKSIEMNKEGVVIAFDFGLKRIGCAVGQKLTGTASPIGTIKNNKKDRHSSRGLLKAVNKRKKLLEYLKKNKNDAYKQVLSKLNLRK